MIEDCGLCTWHTPDFADGMLWSEYHGKETLAGGGVFRPFERGNESWAALIARIGKSLEEISARHAGQTAVIAAHAETVGSSLVVFGAMPLAIGFDLTIAPASLTEWVTDGDPEAWPRPRWTLKRLNDHAHSAE